MKCYTVCSGRPSEGIALAKDITQVIAVGDAGRGRKQALAPVPKGATVVGREGPQKPGTLTDAPARPGEETAVVVLIRDHSGYRGGWKVRDARTPEEWATALARWYAHQGDAAGGIPAGHTYDTPCPGCDVIAPKPVDRVPGWRAIAEGYCAQGDAGRMGGGPEYLAVLADGQAVEIVRHGRLYGTPAVYRVANVGGVLTVSDPREEAEAVRSAAAW